MRGYTGGGIALFTLTTGTPASIGSDRRWPTGRRDRSSTTHRVFVAAVDRRIVGAFFSSRAGDVGDGAARRLSARAWRTPHSPCTAPSCSRPAIAARPTAVITATALLSGSLGILVVGLGPRPWHELRIGTGNHGGIGQLIAVYIAYRHYPETAHLELEQLNPGDPRLSEA